MSEVGVQPGSLATVAQAGGQGLVIVQESIPAVERLARLAHQRDVVVKLMQEVMQEDVHYGYLKDANGRRLSDKPTIFDSGITLLKQLWGLRDVPVFEQVTEDWEKPFFAYVVRVDVYHVATGLYLGCGYGAANSMETKWAYRWVRPEDVPPGLPLDQLPRRRVQTKSGGYFDLVRVPNPQIHDLQNTIRKQAIIRARRDAILTVTACKDLFTQDLEDIEEHLGGTVTQAEVADVATSAQPQSRPAARKSRSASQPRQASQQSAPPRQAAPAAEPAQPPEPPQKEPATAHARPVSAPTDPMERQAWQRAIDEGVLEPDEWQDFRAFLASAYRIKPEVLGPVHWEAVLKRLNESASTLRLSFRNWKSQQAGS